MLHFAGLKAVGERVAQPLRYYNNNVGGTVTLCQAMVAAVVFKLVFNSSATVYGDPTTLPINESPVSHTTNPYGRNKFIVGKVICDLAASDPRWRIALLRYLNPIGAHVNGQIGEDPNGVPNNLLPNITQVAVCKLPELAVFGNDYPTVDGTGVRDYIHVVDLTEGHWVALHALNNFTGVHVWNLGTGRGYSVLQLVEAFRAASSRPVAYRLAPRRPWLKGKNQQ